MKRITNFGGNVAFTPRHRYTPTSEGQVLEILDRHADGRIRALGSLYSWNDAIASDDVVVHMNRLSRIEIRTDDAGTVWAEAGGGCTIARLLRVLDRKAGATLPTLGAVTGQTIGGAISTGTHGSGRASLSHYIEVVRVAAYDPESGRARIFEWASGPELEAARCGLGCMGVILSVRLRCVPEYRVEETVVRRPDLDAVLADERKFPLQQFILMPYSWAWFAFNRREVGPAGSKLRVRALLYRAFNLVGLDISLHLVVKGLLSRLGSPRSIRSFFERVAPRLIATDRTVVDRSASVLTLKHDLFEHEEMELFVPESRLHEAVDLVRRVTCVFAGVSDEIPGPGPADAGRSEMLEEAQGSRGTYTHHYPIFFRRVLPDDTLISMTSGASEPHYTISLFTYLKPGQRADFHRYAAVLARMLVSRIDARLHWGKHFPLSHPEIEHLYPRLEEFRSICRRTDPTGVFRNDFTRRVLGFEMEERSRGRRGRRQDGERPGEGSGEHAEGEAAGVAAGAGPESEPGDEPGIQAGVETGDRPDF